MVTLYLFRIRLERSRQLEAFDEMTRTEALRDSIREIPRYEDGWGKVWLVGDLEDLDSNSMYFRLGKETGAIEPEYDADRASFVEAEHVHAPNTDVFLELDLQVVGLRYERQLGRTPQSIANRLRDVLRRSETMQRSPFTVAEIPQIPDPLEFIRQVRDAYALRMFTFWFSRPNFADEGDLTRKLGALAEQAGASGGRTVISGDSLEPDVVADMTNEAVSQGEDASAQIQRTEGSDRETIHAKDDNPKTVEAGDLDTANERRGVIDRVRAAIDELRG